MTMKPAQHKFLKFMLPSNAFAAVQAETKKWLMECPCGHKQDYWNAGGVRYKAQGEPRQLGYCPVCEKNTPQKIRRKTEAEQKLLP
jgi:hypothetical protein